MALRKFSQFKPRTQQRYKREGIDPKRFDRWLKLKPETQKLVDRKTYSRGFSAPELAKESRRAKVAARVIKELQQTATKREVNKQRVRINVQNMTSAQLRIAMTASGNELRRRAGRKMSNKNNFWY